MGKKTSLGLEENVEALLCYVLGWVSGLVFLLLEKDNKFVRFHAMQSLVTFLALTILIWIFRVIPILGWFISVILGLISLVLWIVGMVKAYQHETYKFPIFGSFAEKQLK